MNWTVYVPDLLFLLVTIIVAVGVASRKFLEAVAYFFAILLAGLTAIALHGPIGYWCFPGWQDHYQDIISVRYLWIVFFISLFVVVGSLLILMLSKAMGEAPEFKDNVETAGRYLFGFLAGYTAAAVVLVAVHTFPGGRDFKGYFPPEPAFRAGPIMRIAPDYQLLTLADYVCNPGHPISGAPWRLRGPFASPEIQNGNYNSFPLRYCVWREMVKLQY